MKIFFTTILLSVAISFCSAQCNLVQSAVSSSTETQVQMYTNAFFVISPGEANEYFWQLTDFSDNIIDEVTTTGQFQIIVFDTPLADSMRICQTVTNSESEVICQLCDTLVYSGSIVNWELVSSNTGINTSINTLEGFEISIYPNPAADVINIDIDGYLNFKSTIYDVEGKEILSDYNNSSLKIETLAKGVYFLEIQDLASGQKIIEKIVKS